MPPGALPPYPPTGAPPPSSSGNRTLIIVLAALVAALVLMTGVAAAFLIARRSETTTSSTFTLVTESPPTSTVDGGSTTTTGATATTTTEAIELSSGQWVDTSVPQPAGESYAVAVSEEYLVISADSGLYAYSLVDKGELVKIETGGTDAGSPVLDGSLLAWWEGSYDETTYEFVDMAIYAKRLPDGDRVEAVHLRPGAVVSAVEQWIPHLDPGVSGGR